MMRARNGFALIALALLAACSGGDKRTVLTVYSPHGKDLLEYYEQGFEASHPTIDVQWVDMGSQEVLERVRAEKPNPQHFPRSYSPNSSAVFSQSNRMPAGGAQENV